MPNFASGFIHNGLCRAAGGRMGFPGSREYARDRRIIYIVVVLSYLLYSLYSSYAALPANYYQLLGVATDVQEKQLRRTYRKLSAIYHPDKGGSEDLFRQLRVAYDTISNPITRFGYDRFGPQVFTWEHARTYRDMMIRGFYASASYYVGSFIFIFGLSYFRSTNYGAYWRCITFLMLACLHLMIVTDARIHPIARYLLPAKVQFEQIQLLQSVSVTVLIAIAQVGPILFPPIPEASSEAAMQEMAALAKMTLHEATQNLQLTMLPYPMGNTIRRELFDKTAGWMYNARVDMDPEVQAARQAILSERT